MNFYKRVLTYTLAVLVLMIVWRIIPFLEIMVSSTPKVVTPRGELSPLEKNSVELFEKSKDSVVFITTQSQVIDYWSRSVMDVPQGTGSGFIWDEFGHIVTNFHVIQDASSATIRLSNGVDYQASLVGADPSHDLAVLKIDAPSLSLKPMPIGESKNLKVGQLVYAIGNPFGLDWTMTTGIISALNRVIDGVDGSKIKEAIQTDASINPGNSGGPLLDSARRVIGVNTSIYSPSGASAGIGFAIPIDLVNQVVTQLISHGKYIRPSIGIEVDERMNRLIYQRYGIEGIVVLGVTKGSGAYKAGLKSAKIYRDGSVELGDVIVKIENQKVSSIRELNEILDNKKRGDIINVTLLRNGGLFVVKIKL
ncbi:HtrA protease/chaperone protein [hydrothermal vent metagenome]|uniref:HtrA protease/chaperone protein n=1 Tax=hydrothermal vent metagenome TaxID=652676 RepID=A0A1W1BNC3_9ZZZZ